MTSRDWRALGGAVLLTVAAACAREPEVDTPRGLIVPEREPISAERPPRRALDAITRGSVWAGMPVPLFTTSRYDVLANEGYTVGYSETKRNPLWAAYELFRVDEPSRQTTPHQFAADTRTAARVDESCFAGTGYARGRQAPSYGIGTRYGAAAQSATLLMSNVSPRYTRLERETWRALERLEANEYAQQLGRIWVVTGPIFDQKLETLSCGIEVPDAFYKIIVAEPDPGATPILLPVIMTQEDNGKERLRNFTTTIDQIEMLAGLDFFPELPEEVETAVESTLDFDSRWDVDRMLTPARQQPPAR
jgi:endonuclease G